MGRKSENIMQLIVFVTFVVCTLFLAISLGFVAVNDINTYFSNLETCKDIGYTFYDRTFERCWRWEKTYYNDSEGNMFYTEDIVYSPGKPISPNISSSGAED